MKAISRFLKAMVMFVAVVMLVTLAMPARADVLVSFTSVTGPVAGAFTWTYTVSLNTGSETDDAKNGGPYPTFFTIYDVVGLIPGSEAGPANFSVAEHTTGTTPAGVSAFNGDGPLPNITWTYTGGVGTQIQGPAPLGTFSFKSTVGNSSPLGSFTGQSTKNNPGVGDDDSRIANGGSLVEPGIIPLTLTCPSSTGQVGVAYSSNLLASGGVPAYTFSIIGSLPPGLGPIDSATGAITGTPTSAGSFTFTGKVVDSNAAGATTQTSDCTIVIAGTGQGCPATKGFWHDPSKHGWPDAAVAVGGVTYFGKAGGPGGLFPYGMIIGGKTYSQLQLIQLMPGAAAKGNGYVITGSQLIAAVLNIAAGAQHSASNDNDIKSANDLLAVDGRMVGTDKGVGTGINYTPSPANNSALVTAGTALDNYNSALGLGCTEAGGLSLGSQPQPQNK